MVWDMELFVGFLKLVISGSFLFVCVLIGVYIFFV